MLQILRNKAQSIVIQAIVVIIALVFIFWGVGTNMMNSREAAIVVNGEEITFQDFQIAYERAFNRVRNQFGGNVPQGLLENLGIKEQVQNQLIQETLLRQGAAEMGIHVSREEIASTVQDMVQFQENGQFDIEKYKSILSLNNFTPTSFEESIQIDMLSQKASLAIGNFATSATDFEINELYTLENSTVAVKYVVFNQDNYGDSLDTSDEALAEWYATVQDSYKTDPQVKLKYLDFSYATVGEKITIDEETIQQYYQDNSADYTTKEQRRARHILFKADESSPEELHAQQEKKANEILELAKQGSDFGELAKQYSEGPSKEQGGDLGLFSRGQMVKPFEDAAFSLAESGISDVVKTTFGYHIIKVEQIVPAVTQPYEDVKDSILQKLQSDQARPLAFQVANEAYEGIIGAGSLDAYLAAAPDSQMRQTDFFNRATPPEEIGNDAKFLDAAFSLKEKELSSLVETANGYVILFAEAIQPPEVPDISSIRDRLVGDYTQAKAAENAKKAADELLKQAKETASLSDSADKQGLTVVDSGYLSRTKPENNTLPQNLVEAAFKLNATEPYPADVLVSGSDYYVIEFGDRKKPEDSMSAEDEERYENAIVQLKQQQVLSGWLKNRREQSKIFTHKNL